ncbi:hypothetical protein P153DRAFT_56272 [Dothidotthia symphoricarpi CBS 119687]|uniref:Uncharacterized protein n=1 Tax=Dothidotthia symphoricarpi CBS 119687 TaxID=1392245 RepID=A0A6A6A9E2_9PLEO|nr:uncharacterized protein P153DRAFT_56272 [Dothidotthia symphoricarpi CBS 119687]KAF2127813.1 hypothetical protein P153DRAFT_56272 [Dothidotthia symphoricarpi CBS 119687]
MLERFRSIHVAPHLAIRFRDLNMLPRPRLRNSQPAFDQVHKSTSPLFFEGLMLRMSRGTSHSIS